MPPVDGLEELDFWTNREAVWSGDVPESLIVLGGGPVGVELGQFFRRMGTDVTIVEYHDRILARLDRDAGTLLRERFEQEGIRVLVDANSERAGRPAPASNRTSPRARRSQPTGFSSRRGVARMSTVSGSSSSASRSPNVASPSTTSAGGRAASGRWAMSQASALLTHLGKYQARVAAANIAGLDVTADYRAIPAAVFTDPQVASVGVMDGDGIVTARYEIDGGRLSTYERPRRPGFLKLAADARRRVLVGAVAVCPEAGEWLGQLTLAVRAQVPLDVLLDTIQPYPTFSEAIFSALRELEDALDGVRTDVG